MSHVQVKFDRALEHLREYERVFVSMTAEPHHKFYWGPIDPKTGRMLLYIELEDRVDLRAAAIVGDFATSLRSTLDYLVAELAVVNDVQPTARHAFPAFLEAKAWDDELRKKPGSSCLGGIVAGLDQVRRWQPFAMHPGEEMYDPLTVLSRLSNTDKHRQLLGFEAEMRPGVTSTASIAAPGAVFVKAPKGRDPHDLKLIPGEAEEFATFFFGRPYPPPESITGSATVHVDYYVTIPASPPKFPKRHRVGPDKLVKITDYVEYIIGEFAGL